MPIDEQTAKENQLLKEIEALLTDNGALRRGGSSDSWRPRVNRAAALVKELRKRYPEPSFSK